MPGADADLGSDLENASVEVDSAPLGSSARPQWNASEFQCSICYELLLDPVVGSCGHDFCQGCIEEWKAQAAELAKLFLSSGAALTSTAVSEAASDALRTTANTVQQLTAEAAALSSVLRAAHQQQLQAHQQHPPHQHGRMQ
eukprot:XP_001690097.1 predicted protein [Chlamydomonas reinhardtii]